MASFGIFIHLAILCFFTVSGKHFLVETKDDVGELENDGLDRKYGGSDGDYGYPPPAPAYKSRKYGGSNAGQSWDDHDCSNALGGFICGMKGYGHCYGPDWEKNGENCYLWSTEKKSWFDAEKFCVDQGAHLASVTSDAIMGHLLDRMKLKGLNNIWIGGTDKDQEGVWKWTDNQPWGYTAWLRGEPNNDVHQTDGEQNCLEMDYTLLTHN